MNTPKNNINSDHHQSLKSVLDLLKELKNQQEKLKQFQSTTYKWNVQHHKNLLKIIDGINQLMKSISKLTGEQMELIHPIHDSTLMEEYRSDFSDIGNGLPQNSTELDISEGLDDLIQQYKDNIYSIELQKSLLSITESQFQELKKESVKIIMPLILRWLQDEEAKEFGLLFLYESTLKYPDLFTSIEQRSIVEAYTKIVNSTINEQLMSGSDVPIELIKMRDFLRTSCQTKA